MVLYRESEHLLTGLYIITAFNTAFGFNGSSSSVASACSFITEDFMEIGGKGKTTDIDDGGCC